MPSQRIKLDASLSLGTREKIALVCVEDKKLLLGITQGNIACLHVFDDIPATEVETQAEVRRSGAAPLFALRPASGIPPEVRDLPNLLYRLKAVQYRHHEIHQNDIGLKFARFVDPILSVFSDAHCKADWIQEIG